MKRTYLYISTLGLLTSLISCTDEINEQQLVPTTQESHVVSLSAGTDKVKTRSYVSEYGEFFWTPEDKIAVLSTDGNFYDFRYDGMTPASRGSFTGTLTGVQTTYAVSPASLKPSIVGNALAVNLPNSFESVEKQTNAPMVAQFGEGEESLQFKNVSGMMLVYVTNIPQGQFKLYVTADNQQLSGTFILGKDENGNLLMSSASSSDKNQIAIAYTGTETGFRSFYVPLPVGTYKNLQVRMESEEGVWFSKTATDMTVARNQMIVMPTITCGASPKTKQNVIAGGSGNVADDINKVLESAADQQFSEGASADLNITIAASTGTEGSDEEQLLNTVEIKNDVVIPTAITTAQVHNAESVPSVILTFDAVPTSTKSVEIEGGEIVENVINITDNAEVKDDYASSKSEVMISIPSVNTEIDGEEQALAEAPSFNINLPTSTVTLSAKGDSARYEVVIANTAENTLRVDKGVTINKVIVGSGNVLLKGTIVDIVNASGKPIYVTLEAGAQITGNIPDNIIIVDNRNPADNLVVALEFDNEKTADGIHVPYQISRLSQLRRMAMLVNGGHENKNMIPYYKCNYELVSSIIVSDVEDWAPIGSEGAPFRGTFNGEGYIVRGNFKVTNGTRHAGIFGYLESATVKNLNLEGSMDYTAKEEGFTLYVGAVAGLMVKGSKIENCNNKLCVSVKSNYYSELAGIVGGSDGWNGRNTILACSNQVYLYNDSQGEPAPGIASYSYNTDIIACYNICDLGTIVRGLNYGTNVVSCWSPFAPSWWSDSSSISYCFFTYGISNVTIANNCGEYSGAHPDTNQLKEMNKACEAYGWIYDLNDATLVKSKKTGIPSNPVKPW